MASGRLEEPPTGPAAVLLFREGPATDKPAGPLAPAVMDQFAMAFSPAFLTVRAGQSVVFTNSESVAHMVKVRRIENDSTLFNDGTDQGTRLERLFDRPGSYDVTCDMHPGMTALVLVHEADHAGPLGADGAWTIPDVAPGRYRVELWSPEGIRSAGTVEVAG